MAAVLEEEEGVDAIVQNKNTALLKIRGLIDVGGRKIFSFVVSQLTNGGVFVSVIVVGRRKLTDSRSAIAGRRSASTRNGTSGR